MKSYVILIEPTRTGFSAYSPDVPGCVAAGRTRASTERLMRRALELHIREMLRSGEDPPEPRTVAKNVRVAA